MVSTLPEYQLNYKICFIILKTYMIYIIFIM